MIILLAILLGVAIGIRTARQHGGNRLDMTQYAAGYGIAFALLGIIATIILHRAVL